MDAARTETLRRSLARCAARTDAQIAAGAPLSLILEHLLIAAEAATSGGMLASVLLLDRDAGQLRHGAAPNLPKAYNDAIDGVAIGPSVGSCGTAAYLGHPVYVTDIRSDALWTDFRDLAAEHDLQACWSTPIEGEDGGVLGTFAVYHRTPRSPTPEELDCIRMISASAGRAIEATGRR